MKHKCQRHQLVKKVFTACLILLAFSPAFAQGGATAISKDRKSVV